MFVLLCFFFGTGAAAAELLAAAGVCTVVRVPDGMGCGVVVILAP
jgi:hypothetical protein